MSCNPNHRPPRVPLVRLEAMAGKVSFLANIGSGGRRRRLARGLVLLAVGTAVVVSDLAAASPWWLVVTFALFGGGVLDVLQAVGHT